MASLPTGAYPPVPVRRVKSRPPRRVAREQFDIRRRFSESAIGGISAGFKNGELLLRADNVEYERLNESVGLRNLRFRGGGRPTDINLTGSPDFPATFVLTGDPGGCTSSRYALLNADAFSAPDYGSVGLEPGRNYLNECFDSTVDLSISRTVQLGGERSRTARSTRPG